MKDKLKRIMRTAVISLFALTCVVFVVSTILIFVFGWKYPSLTDRELILMCPPLYIAEIASSIVIVVLLVFFGDL